MQALGFIETRGFVPAIEGADVMLKTAQVELVGKTFVGGGLVTIAVTGDVGAVTAAVEAGVTAVEGMGHLSLVSHHIIPRPHNDIESMIVRTNKTYPLQSKDRLIESTEPIVITKESTNSAQITLKYSRKEEVDAFVQKFGLEKSLDVLKSLSVAKLRNLTREYQELGVKGRAISKANKELLIQLLKRYYERESKK